MNLRIETYLKVTAMNGYRVCSRIVRASNSLHIEKCKSLVSLHLAQWEQNGQQLRFLFFQIENSVSSNNQSFIRLLFSYFDLHGVSDETKRQKYPRSGPKCTGNESRDIKTCTTQNQQF